MNITFQAASQEMDNVSQA